ncbi:CASP-like protein 4A1 isoform X2 [Juglans microcarpa x Juglans regia]|uniref:CASP-like protein 4A1 isoform X2 n=1 Tax=Juglans microcarpa x Juglans regia TaxID=2249226 RepID=UPI001B7F77C4|nr:CASP-like protein 4A1 isoform X2 [Juglans microcarpa x Juglans regia]
MSVNSNQEMEKYKEADKDEESEAKNEPKNHTHSIEKTEPEPKPEQEKHIISDPPSPTTHSFPPHSHPDHEPPSLPLDSSSPSSLSSDHSYHGHDLNHSFAPDPDAPPVVPVNRSSRAYPAAAMAKVDPGAQDGFVSFGEVEASTISRDGANGGGGNRRLRPNLSILRRTRWDNMVKKALLSSRISGFVLCLISFSVMAADKDQGWAIESFYRYKELRYCMAVNVIGSAYSGLQAYDLVNYITTGKHIVWHPLRRHFDFSMDQHVIFMSIKEFSRDQGLLQKADPFSILALKTPHHLLPPEFMTGNPTGVKTSFLRWQLHPWACPLLHLWPLP